VKKGCEEKILAAVAECREREDDNPEHWTMEPLKWRDQSAIAEQERRRRTLKAPAKILL